MTTGKTFTGVLTIALVAAGLVGLTPTLVKAQDPDCITPVSAASTTTVGGSRTIDYTIDGSDLSSGGASTDVPAETHQVNSDSAGYWLSGSGAVSGSEVLTFDLGGTFDVTGIHQWLYTRTGPETDRGFKTFDVYVSTDGGSSYSLGVSAATLGDFAEPAVGDLPAVTKTFATQSGVTHIELRNLVNFGDPSFYGLSEIRFQGGPAVPPPATPGTLIYGK